MLVKNRPEKITLEFFFEEELDRNYIIYRTKKEANNKTIKLNSTIFSKSILY